MVLFKLAERAIGLISTLILARLLVPADFGIVAMATAFAAILDVLTSFSFDLALIQRRDAERRHYDTAWTFNVLAGLAVAAGMVLLAAPAAAYFREPAVESVIRFLALCMLVQGFQNIGIVAFQKDLELHKEFVLGITKKLVGLVVAVGCALWLNNYWALLFGMLAVRVAGVALSYAMHPYRPRFSLAAASELLRFSSWMLLSNIVILVNSRGIDFVVGRLGNATMLGIYSVAYELSNLATTELVHPITRAVFPGYVAVAGNDDRLRDMFMQVLRLTALIALPIVATIACFAEPVVRILLGSKWLEAIPLVQVLAFYGAIRALHNPTGALFLAVGKPAYIALINGILAAIMIPMAVLLMSQYGLYATPIALLTAGVVAALVNFSLCRRILRVRWREFGRAMAPAFAATLVLCAVALVARGLIDAPTATIAWLAQQFVAMGFALLAYTGTIAALWWTAGRPSGPEAQVYERIRQAFR
jgi:lipopolysaccharide exporter